MAQRGSEAFSVTKTSEEQIDDFYKKQGSEPPQAIPYIPAITPAPTTEVPAAQPSVPATVSPIRRNVVPLPVVTEGEPVAKDYESLKNRQRTAGKIGVTLLAITLAAGGAKFVADNWAQQTHPSTTKPHLLPQPNASTPDSEIIAVGPDTDPNTGIVGTAPSETSTPTISATGTQPSPEATITGTNKLPNVLTTTPADRPNSKSTVPPVAAPHPQTSSATSPHSTQAPRPSSKSPEKKQPPLGTIPPKTALDILSAAVNEQQVSDIESSYQNVSDYLQAADSGELNFLDKNSVTSYQHGPLLHVFSNAAAAQALGHEGVMTTDNLRGSSNQAAQITAFTDNALNNASQLRSSVGDDIIKIGYANESLSSDIVRRMNNGDDVSVGDSNNEAIVGKVRTVHGVAVVPVIASYSNSLGNYTMFRWEALIPVNRVGGFVATTVYEKQLEANTYTPPSDTPDPVPTDTPTPTPTDTLYSESDFRGHGHHKPRRD